jgi:hypothetical protein
MHIQGLRLKYEGIGTASRTPDGVAKGHIASAVKKYISESAYLR